MCGWPTGQRTWVINQTNRKIMNSNEIIAFAKEKNVDPEVFAKIAELLLDATRSIYQAEMLIEGPEVINVLRTERPGTSLFADLYTKHLMIKDVVNQLKYENNR